MENGRVTAGTHEELMSKEPEYAAIYRAQEGGKRQMSRNKETAGSIVMHTVWEKKWLSLGILVAVVHCHCNMHFCHH